MAKFPEPPGIDALRTIPPVLHILTPGTTMTRLCFAGGDHPTTWDAFRYYGPTISRFDHHLPDGQGRAQVQDRGIMYLATGPQAIPTCLAEVFQATRLIDRQSRHPVLSGFPLCAELTLLELTGPFATAIGASMALHSGPRPRAQRWAQQLYEAYPAIDGLLYSASMYGNTPAVALFERGARAIPARPVFHRELRDTVMANILTETGRLIGYGVI
ncbi:MAG: RES family NAD+ phosphorylase [Halioglobus sp.]|nr:RES family NAD+ phosphorylase [Halioglobus sp.]